MAWNGAGTFLLDPAYSPEINGTVIDAVRYNGLTTDIAAGITVALAKDGQNAATANIPFGGFKATGLGAATSAGDATRFEQVYIRGETNIATAATCSIFALTETTLNLTGVTTVTSFGVGTAGDLKYCTAVAAFQITYDAVNLITPGLTNLAIAAGDWFMVKSKGGSAAEVVQLTRRASLTTRISDLGAAVATNTIANGIFAQTWGWNFTGVQKGLHLTGTSAGGTGDLLTVEATAAINNLVAVKSNEYGGLSFFTLGSGGSVVIGGLTKTVTGNATGVSISGCSAGAGSNGNGGSVSLSAGAKDGLGTDGTLTLTGPPSGASLATETFSSLGAAYTGTGVLSIGTRRLVLTGSVPTLTAGGAGGTIEGSDKCFAVTVGAGSPTSIVVTFANAKATAPKCVFPSGTQAGVTYTWTATTGAITITASAGLTAGQLVSCLMIELA